MGLVSLKKFGSLPELRGTYGNRVRKAKVTLDFSLFRLCGISKIELFSALLPTGKPLSQNNIILLIVVIAVVGVILLVVVVAFAIYAVITVRRSRKIEVATVPEVSQPDEAPLEMASIFDAQKCDLLT